MIMNGYQGTPPTPPPLPPPRLKRCASSTPHTLELSHFAPISPAFIQANGARYLVLEVGRGCFGDQTGEGSVATGSAPPSPLCTSPCGPLSHPLTKPLVPASGTYAALHLGLFLFLPHIQRAKGGEGRDRLALANTPPKEPPGSIPSTYSQSLIELAVPRYVS